MVAEQQAMTTTIAVAPRDTEGAAVAGTMEEEGPITTTTAVAVVVGTGDAETIAGARTKGATVEEATTAPTPPRAEEAHPPNPTLAGATTPTMEAAAAADIGVAAAEATAVAAAAVTAAVRRATSAAFTVPWLPIPVWRRACLTIAKSKRRALTLTITTRFLAK